MRNKNRLTSLLLVLIFTLGITINSTVPIYAWISGGTGGTVSGTPGNSLGYPSTSTYQVRSYVVSLVRTKHKDGIFDSEIVLGSAIVEGNQNVNAGNTPLEQTWSYFVFDFETGKYRPATKLDFIYGKKVVLRPMGQSLKGVFPKGTLKELVINPKSNYEQVIEYYTKRKPGQLPDPNVDPKTLPATTLVKNLISSENFIFAPGENKENVINDFENGDLAVHVEPMFQETKPNKVTLTGSQLQYYASEDTTANGGTKRYNGRYYTNATWITTGVVNSAHLLPEEQGNSVASLSINVEGYDKSKHIKEAKAKYVNSFMVDNGRDRLTKASGIYILKLMKNDTTTKHPTEINIPPTDFHMTTLKPVPNEDGLLIDLEKGEITLDVRGGYNGDTRGYGEGGNTNVDEDGNNGNLDGADNSSITYKGHPWKETDGSLMDKKNPILFAKALSNNAQSTKISCPIHGANAIPIEDDKLESEFGIPGLARVFNYSVFPNDRLEQEWVENPKGIVADDGCRIFPELQEHLHNKTIETIESNPDTSALLNSKVREALKINGLKLNWDERNISKDFLAKDDRIKFQVYLQTDYQKLQGKGEGIVSYNEHITETMDKNNVSSLPGNKSLKLKVQNNDEGTLTLSWDPNDPKIKETLDYSKSIFVTASINWIEPEDRQTHAYEGDKWLRTESINSNNVQGGNGWINNSLQFELRIPRPNLKANEVTPRYDEEREMICIEGVGFIDKLMPGQNTISSDHTIRLYDANGNLIGEQTKQFKDAQLGTEVDFEEICFKVPKPKPSEEVDYVVEYEINPSEDKPKTEETFEDNIVVNEITIGGDFNWKATNVTASAVNTTPSGIEEFVYKLDVVGQGILEKNELPNTPTYKTDHIIRYWDKENPGSVQEFPLKPTKEVSRGQSIEYSQLQYPDNWLQPEITVPRHTTRVVNILRKRRDCPRC